MSKNRYELINEPWAGDVLKDASLLLPGVAGKRNLVSKNAQKKLIVFYILSASYAFRLRSTKRSTEPFAPWTIGVWYEIMIRVL